MISLIAFPLSASAKTPDFIPGKTEIVSAFGKIPGQDLYVHVLVAVPQGSDKNEIANEAVRQQGARPIDHTEFSLTGLEWTQTNPVTGNVLVTQFYNPNGDPNLNEPVKGEDVLLNTHATWTNVDNSDFEFDYGGETTRCPSIVRECPGRQISDGFNDVAWLPLKGKNTLGVTWFNTNTVEADMAMNTNFGWSIDSPNTGIDVETVFLHENGHVVGLGHSDVNGAVMEAVYAGLRLTLHTDDECGIQELYGTPCSSPPPPTPGTPNSLDITHGSEHGSDGKSGTYSDRDTVHIFVKALDGIDGVVGVPIHVVVNSDKSTLSGDTTTDDNGVAHIHYKVKAGRDGTGVYHISASGGGLSCNHGDGACHADFTVQR